MKINIPSPTSPTTLNVPATAPVLEKKLLLVLVPVFTTSEDEGVVWTTVVTVMMLPLEVERNVDFDGEGELAGPGGRVGVEAEVGVEGVVGVEVGGPLVSDVLVESEVGVDVGLDVEVFSVVVVGGEGVDVLEVEVVELREYHGRLITSTAIVTHDAEHSR